MPTASATATRQQQQQHGKIAFYSASVLVCVRIFHLLHLMLPKLSSKIHFLREHEFSDVVAHMRSPRLSLYEIPIKKSAGIRREMKGIIIHFIQFTS